MACKIEEMSHWPLLHVAEFMSGADPGSRNAHLGASELMRRQAECTERSTLAAEEAAQAAQETAKPTRRAATYMLWSVVVLAGSSIASLVISSVK